MNTTNFRRLFSVLTASILSMPMVGLLPQAGGILLLAGISTEASALPRDRARGRQGARYSRQTGRQVSRARRRGFYALPRGYAPFRYGRYTYYRAGGLYYYPYMHGGSTVYIQVNVDASGNPGPPPSAGSVEIYF